MSGTNWASRCLPVPQLCMCLSQWWQCPQEGQPPWPAWSMRPLKPRFSGSPGQVKWSEITLQPGTFKSSRSPLVEQRWTSSALLSPLMGKFTQGGTQTCIIQQTSRWDLIFEFHLDDSEHYQLKYFPFFSLLQGRFGSTWLLRMFKCQPGTLVVPRTKGELLRPMSPWSTVSQWLPILTTGGHF